MMSNLSSIRRQFAPNVQFTTASSTGTPRPEIGMDGRMKATDGRRTALVIEDEPLVAMELSSILEDMGYEVCGIAETRREAVSQAMRNRPSLILADLRLRGGDDGIETVREITGSLHAAVVYVTGNRQQAAQRLPSSAVLVGKPFMLPSLQSAIHTAEKRALA